MNLFGFGGNKQKAPTAEQQARDEQSLQSIVGGGLPLNAIDRLTEQKQRERAGNRFFTSDLSVNELLLTHECGFMPLGQVMGSCVYHVGWQWVPQSSWVTSSQEMAVMTQSQYDARNLAFSRLRQEAKLLGADGVVGVRFTRQASNFGTGEIEFMAIGTAVRRIGAPPPVDQHEPFVSNLSGQDHWALRKTAMAPLGFVFGTCAWYQYPDWLSSGSLFTPNLELPRLTQGTYTAREIAMDRMEAEAHALGATGIVCVDYETYHEHIEQNQNSPGGFIMHFTAWGTAIGLDPVGGPQRIDVKTTIELGTQPTS